MRNTMLIFKKTNFAYTPPFKVLTCLVPADNKQQYNRHKLTDNKYCLYMAQ